MDTPLVFVTGNERKLQEVASILGEDCPFELIRQDLDLKEIQGSEEEICQAKCLEAVQIVKGPVVVEDTSLALSALNGLPGPYVKWFLEKIGAEGIYRMLEGFSDKMAEAICTVAYTSNESQPIHLLQGRVRGEIVAPKLQGEHVFGFDSIFKPDGHSQTYAEMSLSSKNATSHRYHAFEKLKQFFAATDSASVVLI